MTTCSQKVILIRYCWRWRSQFSQDLCVTPVLTKRCQVVNFCLGEAAQRSKEKSCCCPSVWTCVNVVNRFSSEHVSWYSSWCTRKTFCMVMYFEVAGPHSHLYISMLFSPRRNMLWSARVGKSLNFWARHKNIFVAAAKLFCYHQFECRPVIYVYCKSQEKCVCVLYIICIFALKMRQMQRTNSVKPWKHVRLILWLTFNTIALPSM